MCDTDNKREIPNGSVPKDSSPEKPPPLKKHIKRRRLGVWDFYEEKYDEVLAMDMLTSISFEYEEVLESLPYVRRMIKDVANIPGCRRLVSMYALNRIVTSLIPAASIWFDGQILTVIQTSIDNRTVDKYLLFRIAAGRFVCSVLTTFLYGALTKIEQPLNSRIRRWYAAHSFDAHARLDFPTFSSAPVRRQLEATGDSIFGKTVVWGSLQLVTDLVGTTMQLVAHTVVLIGVLRGQQDGLLLVLLSMVAQVYSWVSRVNLFKPARVWVARTVHKDYLKMRGWKNVIGSSTNRKEVVVGNLGEHASSEYKKAVEDVGDADGDWWEWQDYLFDSSGSWSQIMEDPLSFLPQIIFTLRAVQYPANLPISLASLHLVQGAASTFAFTLYGMVSKVQSVGETLSSVRKLYEIRSISNTIKDGSVPFPTDSAEIKSGIALEFRNVSFKYPDTENYALRNVSFNLLPGQLCVIVGSNGSGKSTILKLITRLYDPEEGEIFFGGHDIKTLKLHDLREAVSVLFQNYTLFPLTIRENIAIGNPASASDDECVLAAARLADAEQFVSRLPDGFDSYIDRPACDEYAPISEGTRLFNGCTVDFADLRKAAGIRESTYNGTELSGGQEQRLAVARTFMRAVVGGDSKVGMMLFDEPSASLDPIAEHNLFDRLRELRGSKTMVFSSHRFGKLTRHADLILYMDESRVVEAGAHDALIARDGEYARLWKLQVEAFVS